MRGFLFEKTLLLFVYIEQLCVHLSKQNKVIMTTHKCESTDRAKAIKIGKVENEDVYYLDIISQDGNQQTVGTGTLEEVVDYIQHIKLI